MNILFVGQNWFGSNARALREALCRQSHVIMDDVAEDAFSPKIRSKWLRLINRLLASSYRRELEAVVLQKIQDARPDVLVTYKGWQLHSELLNKIKYLGVKTVNVYPDVSPHAHGEDHKKSVGEYDLVISSKFYHPKNWRGVYGYNNRCEFVPQGYDPALHLFREPPSDAKYDVGLVATYRPEYARLISRFFDALSGTPINVLIGGAGWERVKKNFPENWEFPGAVHGRSYVERLRQAKICIAPVNREMVIGGKRQPGDEDTTRTYEMAAAHCFFIHQRTEFVQTLYSSEEVPLFSNGEELAHQVLYYLENEEERSRMAKSAHERAVPSYSIDARVSQILELIRDIM